MQKELFDDEIHLREYLKVLKKRWRAIVYLAISATLLGMVMTYFQKSVYEAKATILVRSGSDTSIFSQIGNLGGLAGIKTAMGVGALNDYTEVLKSRSVAEKVLEDLKLKDRFEGWNNPKNKHQTLVTKVQRMLKEPKIDGNMIKLTVECGDRDLVKEIADGFINAFSLYWNKLNSTQARNKREYIESQIPRVEQDLNSAEKKYKSYTLLSPRTANLSAAASNILGMSQSSQSQGIEISRLSRELDIQNTVYTMLRREYASVKLDESKEIPPFSIVDEPERPLTRSKPSIKLNILMGLVFGLFSGISIAFFQEYWEKSGKR